MADLSNSTTLSERAIFDAYALLLKIKNMNALIFLAGEATLSMSRDTANAITQGCDVISDYIDEALKLLGVEDAPDSEQEGGAS